MLLLIAGLVLLLGAHGFTMSRERRAALREKLGDGGYKGLYSVIALIGLALVIYGFGQYRATGWINVWNPPAWTRHLSLLLMLPVFILLFSTRAGAIKKAVKHPMLLAVKIWATAHLIANGDLGSMLLFGGFLAWAVMARISIKRRPEEALAAAERASMRFGSNDMI
ncbi:MAG: NnrU family protein, partial [Bosea sp. (in: a-proteobacteria)]